MPDQDLVPDIEAYINQYVVFDHEHYYRVVGLYVLHTHLIKAASYTPYLWISGGAGAGKTTLTDVLELLCRCPIGGNIPNEALIERIDREQPTLLLDEVDTVFTSSRRNDPLRATINEGYTRAARPFTRRRNTEVREFKIFCPKVLSGIDNSRLHPTIKSRCIPIEMKKHKPPKWLLKGYAMNARERLALLERIEAFRVRFSRDVANMEFAIVGEYDETGVMPLAGLDPRQNELALPLLAIAKTLGIQSEAKRALENVFAVGKKAMPDRDQEIAVMTHDAFGERDKLSTAEFLEEIGPTIYDDRSLAALLRPHGIGPLKIRTEDGPRQGYRADQFREMWSRFNLNGHHAESEPEEVEEAA
jgi:hypothetical protein